MASLEEIRSAWNAMSKDEQNNFIASLSDAEADKLYSSLQPVPQNMNPVDRWATTASQPIQPKAWDYQHPFGNGTPLGGWIGANSEQQKQLWNSNAMQGIKEAYQGLRQRIGQAGEFLGMASPGSSQAFTNAANQERSQYQQLPQAQSSTAGFEKFVGNVLPYLAIPGSAGLVPGAIAGGGSAAMTFDPNNQTVVQNPLPTILGTVTGGILGKIGSKVNAPDIVKLRSEGIEPSIGQVMGGTVKAAEDRATSVPLIGDMLKAEQRRGVAQLNTAVINRALKPSGASIPKGLIGHDAVAAVDDALGAKYDALLPQLSAKADQPFVQQMQNLNGIVQNASTPIREQLANILKNEVVDKFKAAGGQIDGPTFKGMQSNLGTITANIRSNPSSTWDMRLMADALDETKTALRDLLTRNNPTLAPQLEAINKSWANFDRLRRASAMDKTGTGFNALQLQQAVKAADKSKNKAAFAKGEALMQDLSNPAYRVFGGTYPDSGTAGRIAQYEALHNKMAWPLALASAPFLFMNIPGVRGSILRAASMRGTPAVIGTGLGKLGN